MSFVHIFIPAPHPTQAAILKETLQSFDRNIDNDFRVVLHRPLYGACNMEADSRPWLFTSDARGRVAAMFDATTPDREPKVFLSPGDTVDGDFTLAVQRTHDLYCSEAADALFQCDVACAERIQARGIDGRCFMWATWRPTGVIAEEVSVYERCMAVGWDMAMHNLLLLPENHRGGNVRVEDNQDGRRIWLDVPRNGFGMRLPHAVQQWTPITQVLVRDNLELAPRLIATMVGQPVGEVKRFITEQGAARDFRAI